MRVKSKLTLEQRNSWRTPLNLFHGIQAYLGITCDMDVASSRENKLLDVYFTKEDDALCVDWSEHGRCAWLNPPYSNISPWIDKSIEQQERGTSTVMLVPNSTDTGWFIRAKKCASEVHIITGGRVAFIHPVTGKLKSINTGGSMLLYFNGDTLVRRNQVIEFPERDLLLSIGDKTLSRLLAA